ncbi:MAG: hypothetical protein Ta2B_23320 [Termitinemataceae bacterium]|nr:MAG: hypothetical protein Ta2B_23320 [Termitinemataceae bacterium]
MIKVLHKRAGDVFDAGAINGNIGKGLIECINEDGSINISLSLNDVPPTRLPIIIGLGFVRPIQLRRLLRDLTTLGVEQIDLFGTHLSDKSYTQTNLFKDGGAEEALIAGAVQARDTVLPRLNVHHNLNGWLKCNSENGIFRSACLFACDNVNSVATFATADMSEQKRIVAAIGSERGWSHGERALLDDSGFSRVGLGSRALRTETAAIAAAAMAVQILLKRETNFFEVRKS